MRMPGAATASADGGQAQRSWAGDFVNSLGKKPDELNPNTRIKVELPTASRAKEGPSLLKRR